MLGYKLLYLASLITFTFGALTFSVLTLFYWREKRLHRQPGQGSVFPVLTVVCAAAFLGNLGQQVATALNASGAWVTLLSLLLSLLTGLLPPLLLHLVYNEERTGLRRPSAWPWVLFCFYLCGGLTSLWKALEDAELAATDFGPRLEVAPVLMLAAAGALGLLMQSLSRRSLGPVEQHHRRWNRVLLALMLLCAAANLVWPASLVSLFPDYLVLGFFCVTLYYKERLVFFDLLIKRGAFFAVALVVLTFFFAIGSRVFERLPEDWSRPWICALLLLPFWLMGPWIYSRLEHSIDQLWLGRRYSPANAEREFVRQIQAATGDDDLQRRAASSLSDIFQAPAEVCFATTGQGRLAPTGPEPDSGLLVDLEQNGACVGWLALSAKPGSIPYLSDDRRLFQSLARTLSVVLENVRFRQQTREQEKREQQLRWLASRAELKALRAQINPHFLFNALNAIAGLIPGQPQLADETVEQLAEVFRYALRKSEKEWVRLDEEVEFITAYLRVEQARFGDRLAIEIAVEPAAGAVPVPCMTIQPLIENAIKHGVSTLPGRGCVGLHAAMHGEVLRVEVRDNGPGFPPGFSMAGPAGAPGHGLRNIMERLHGYYGETAQLHWESTEGGTVVRLAIPPLALAEAVGKSGHDARPDRG